MEVEMVGGHLTIHPQVLIIKSQQVAVLILVVEVVGVQDLLVLEILAPLGLVVLE